MGAYSVQDALKYATSIDVQSFGMTGNQVMVRGMDTMHSLILVDGKRMADEDTPATQNVYVLNRINMADVERIEIIRGAGSAIYGSEAMGGVINIITKKASSPNAVVGFSTGSKETSEYFNYASGRQGKVAVKIDGRRTKVRERFSSPANSNQFGNKLYFNADVDYAFDENRGLDITAGYMKEKLQTNAASTSATYGLSTQNQSYNQERKDFGLMYYGKDQKNDYSFRTYYSELSKDQTAIKTYKDRPYSTVFGSFLNTNDEHKFKKLVVEGKDTYTANENNKVTYGAEYKHETSDRTYRSLFLPVMPWGVGVSDHTIDTYAAYVQDEIQLGDKWNAPGAGVIESVEQTDEWTGVITLKLEEGEYGAVSMGDLCMGIYHSEKTDENAENDEDDGRGNRKFAGFYTVYFEVTNILDAQNKKFGYKLRPVDEYWNMVFHPCAQMNFVAYGNKTNVDRQTSCYSTRTYTRYLVNQDTWD